MRNSRFKEYVAAFGPAELAELTKGLDATKRANVEEQYAAAKKGMGLAWVMTILTLDRIWLGQMGLGLAKFLTAGGVGIWWLIDLFSLGSRVNAVNRAKAEALVAAAR